MKALKGLLPRFIVVAAHASETYGPVQALTRYLDRRKVDFDYVELPFLYSGLPGSKIEWHRQGKLAQQQLGHKKSGPDPWLWMRDFWLAFKAGWRAGRERPVPLYIGVDPLNAAAGVLLKRLGRVERVAYYVIDYTDRRFGLWPLNAAYHAFDRFAAKGSDVVWNLSSRMQAVRAEQGIAPQRNQLVPVGVELDQVRLPKAGQRRQTLLYMGSLHASKGIQLIIQAMPEILKAAPRAELRIYGAGPYEAEMKRVIAASPARQRIHFGGSMKHERLFREIPRFGVAFAPYADEPHSYSYWCDPTKPKEYLACGLPLIITKVPWIWERVADAKSPLGLAIDYEQGALVRAALRLLKDKAFYARCRKNALAFASGLRWDSIYDEAFAKVAKLA